LTSWSASLLASSPLFYQRRQGAASDLSAESRCGGGGSVEREFNAANAYRSKKEVISHCIEFGKQIIDGKSATFKVDEL